MRILVIGGTRFIGLATIRLLHEQGHTVAIFHRGQTSSMLPPGVQEILGERAQLLTFKKHFADFKPDIILDTIAFIEQDGRDLVELCKDLVSRVVLISSQDVYRAFARVNRTEPGPPDPLPITENSPLREKRYPHRGLSGQVSEEIRRRMHNYDKIPIEHLVMSDANIAGTILRVSAVYGPGDYQHRLFEFLKRMDDNRPVIILDERLAQWRWTRGYIENIAAAIALAVTDERARGRIYNIGEAHALTMAEWVRAIGDASGWHGKIVTLPADRLPSHLVFEGDATQDVLVDTTRIREELGYRELISLDEAFRRTAVWERAHPPEEIDAQQFDYAAEDAVLAELL